MRNSQLFKKAIAKGLKVAHTDIETAPELSWHYGSWDINIGFDQTEVPMQITSIGYMFEGDKKVTVKSWDYPSNNPYGFLVPNKDKKLLEEIVPVLNSADIVIGQNLDKFDVKKIQWRLNELKLPPLKNLITVDTLKMSRKVFSPPTHKLDFKSKCYGRGGKIKQDMRDCIDVAKGDPKKTTTRLIYNGKDVLDERHAMWREIDYWKLPASIVKMLMNYIKDPRPHCIKCAARRQKRFDVKRTKVGKEFKYQCINCDYTWRIKK